jgi:methylthioribose-1-phosphate isomerase
MIEFYSHGVTPPPMRTIWWESGAAGAPVTVIDQRQLPHELVVSRWTDVAHAITGISDMQVRGAPLIGVAAAHGLALAAREDPSDAGLAAAGAALVASRPTAVNLSWAVAQGLGHCGPQTPLAERAGLLRTWARSVADADAAECHRIGTAGVPLLEAVFARTGRPVNVLTHCNAGWLACVERGTATAPVYEAHERGVPVHVWVSETRPRNQGAALTAWELGRAGVPHTLIVDNAAAHVMGAGLVDLVLVGADRVAANGDAANKIGTALKAYAAHALGVPFYVAIPWSTFDDDCPDGRAIPLEERAASEVQLLEGQMLAPLGTAVRNWGFDVTPAALIGGFVTPDGVVEPRRIQQEWRRRLRLWQ